MNCCSCQLYLGLANNKSERCAYQASFMNFRTIPPILLMELNNMFSNIRWSIGPAFRFNTHSITENNVSRTRIASISEQKKTFRFPFGATPPPPTSIFSATRKKKRGTTTFAATCYQRINHHNMIRVKASQNILFAPFFVDTNKEMQLQLDIVLRKYEFETLLISK